MLNIIKGLITLLISFQKLKMVASSASNNNLNGTLTYTLINNSIIRKITIEKLSLDSDK